MTTQEKNLSPGAEQDVYIFRKCVPLQVKLEEVSRIIGKADNLTCLDIGVENGMISYHLRKLRGTWHSAVFSDSIKERVKELVNTNVDVITNNVLPYKNKMFDIVVIVDTIEKIKEDSKFIEECHRVLQPTGKLILIVPNIKSASLVNILRRLLGVVPEKRGLVREGYSESDLFGLLKHGFDVHQVRSFSRFFLEITDAIVVSMANKLCSGTDSDALKKIRLYRMASLFYLPAYYIDVLLFMTKGFNLIATAKRRAWRPRNTPVLIDGRSISEAVLSKAGH